MKKTNNLLYLFNPKSNEGNAERLWRKACGKHPILPKEPVDLTKIDIASLIREKKPDIIVVAGGDGSINSVCKALVHIKEKPIVSIIPFGFGNALSYCLGVETVDKAVEVITKQENKITIDLMKTNINDHEIGVFNVSAGYDARIVLHKQDFRYIGIGSYVLSAMRSFVTHDEKEMTFTIDKDVTLTARASSLVIANCPVIGQNYVISPNAKLNDGFLDCTVFSTKYAYLSNLRLHGFKHPFYTELGKVRFKAKHLRIEGEPFIQVDGDPVMQKEGLVIEILPSQLTFLCNTQDKIDQLYTPFK